MLARHIRRWAVANLAAVMVASLVLVGPVAAAQVYGVTQASPVPATVDYSDLVTFRGSYNCVNGLDPADLCPTATQSHTATFALRPASGSSFTAIATVTTSFRFTTSSSGCATTCAVDFSVVWKAGRAPGSISIPAGVYDVRLTTTLTPDEVILDGALTIDHEDTTTTYTGATSGEAGTALGLGATVADQDLGMFAGTSLWLPDLNFGVSSPVSFALYDATNTALVTGPVTAGVAGFGSTFGTPTLALPGAGTYQLRTIYPGNAFYRASEDVDTITVTPSATNTPPVLELPGPITVEAMSASGAPVSFSASATDAEDEPDPDVTCDWVSGSTFPIGTTTVTCSATDDGGSTTPGSFTVTVVDTTPPEVTIWTSEAIGGTGWFNLASNDEVPGLTVEVSASDLVGVSSLSCSDGSLDLGPLDPGGDSVVLGDGQHVIACTALDAAGNAAPMNASFDVDQAAPTSVVFVGGPADGSAYDFWFVPPEPTCTADDGASGLASCDVAGYSDLVGPQLLIATATDVAGNTATVSLAYDVLPWTLVGFEGLVDAAAVNTAKAGTPVQLRFEVFAGAIELTSADGVTGLTQTQLDCGTGLPLGASIAAASRSPLRYAGGEFAWSWLAPRDRGTCWSVALETADGSSLTATFQLR